MHKNGDTSTPEKSATARNVVLFLFVLGGIPAMLLVHAMFFADRPAERNTPQVTVPSDTTQYSSLDEIPALFDPTTREALARYCGEPGVGVELVGRDVAFSPKTGAACLPLTPEIVEKIRQTQVLQENASNRAALEREKASNRSRAQQEARSFRERYVVASALDRAKNGAPTIVLAIAGSRGGSSLETRIGAALRSRGRNADTSILRDSVFDGAVYERLVSGDTNLLRQLGLASVPGKILIGRQDVSEVDATGIQGVRSFKGVLTLSIVALESGRAITIPPIDEIGTGVDEARALKALEERLIEGLFEQHEFSRSIL